MQNQLVFKMKKLANLFFATGILVICSFSTLHAQFPWTEDFSDNNGEGVRGGCGAAATSCATYSAPSDWSMSGNYNGLTNTNDWFRVYYWAGGGTYVLDARDVDNEVCYTSNTINVASAVTVDIEVDIHEYNCESGDYGDVYIIVDGRSAYFC